MLSAAAITTLVAPSEDEGGSGFHAPTIEEFFPSQVFGQDTFWGPTRINLIGLIMTAVVCLCFWAAFRKSEVVPSKVQSWGEMAIDLVEKNVVLEAIGEKGRRYSLLLITLFFTILAFNLSGIIPLLNIAVTAVIGGPLLFALIAYVTFNWEGIREHGFGNYMKMNLFPPGVPAPIYVLVTPIEFISTFILRPVTLTIRLLANMMSGHLLLVLFFSATQYFLFEAAGVLKLVAAPSLAMGFAFTAFELLVAFLQAYIFTLLTAVYISGAISHEH